MRSACGCSADGRTGRVRPYRRSRSIARKVSSRRSTRTHGIEGGRCDRLLFVIDGVPSRLVAVPIELKSGGVDASKAAQQLQTGADFVHRFVPPTARLKCRPILIHGRSLDRRERKTLNRAKIRFRGQHLTIATARCGRPKNLAGASATSIITTRRINGPNDGGWNGIRRRALPSSSRSARRLLRDRLGAPRPGGFKELLASCPVDLDIDRPRDLGRDIEI